MPFTYDPRLNPMNLHVVEQGGPQYLSAGGEGWGNNGGMDFASLDNGVNTTPSHVLQNQLLQIAALKNMGHGGMGSQRQSPDYMKQFLETRKREADMADSLAKAYGAEGAGSMFESMGKDPNNPNKFFIPGSKKLVDGQVMDIPGEFRDMDPVVQQSFLENYARGHLGLQDASSLKQLQQAHRNKTMKEFQELHALGPAGATTVPPANPARSGASFFDNPFGSGPRDAPLISDGVANALARLSYPAPQPMRDPGGIDALMLQLRQGQAAPQSVFQGLPQSLPPDPRMNYLPGALPKRYR